MAFGIKYQMNWDDQYRGDTFKLDVEVEGYAAGVTELRRHIDQPFEQQYNESPWVKGSESIATFIVTKTDQAAYDADFYDSVYKTIRIKFYANSILKWVGWLKPENTTREFNYPEVVYRVSATDGLNDLKDIEYTGFSETGRQSMLQLVKNAIDFTGITDLDFFIQCNIYEDGNMIETEEMFEEIQGQNEVFYSRDSGEIKPNSCYEALEKIVKSFYCSLAMVDGYWQITNGQEYVSEYTIFEYSSLTVASGDRDVAYDREVDITSYERPEGNKLELSKVAPIKKLRTTFHNRNLGTNEITTNPDFDVGGTPPTGWTNSGWDSFATATEDGDSVGNTTEFTTNSDIKYIEASTFTLAGATVGDLISVKFEVKLKTITLSSGSDFPKVYPALEDPKGVEVKGFARFVNEVDGEFQKVQHFFAVTGDGIYTLRLYVEPRDPTSTLSYLWNNVVVTTGDTASTSTDSLYVGTVVHEAYQKEEETLSFLESHETSDVGALTYGGGVLTSSWTRFGNSGEGLSLIQLFTQQYLNDRQANHDLITATLYDRSEVIHFNTILTLNSKKYRFVEMSKNYATKLVSGTIQQVDNTSDIAHTLKPQSLTSVEGSSVGDAPDPLSGWSTQSWVLNNFMRGVDDEAITGIWNFQNGFKVGGVTVIDGSRVLQNVTGLISMFTNDVGYITSADATLQKVTDNSNTADGFVSTTRAITIGAASSPIGQFHITTGASGQGSVHALGDELVLESASDVGMTFLSPGSENQWIFFGDVADNTIGGILYNHVTNSLHLKTNGVTDRLVIGSSGRIGIGTDVPDGTLHVFSGSAGVVTANTGGDDLVIEGSAAVGMSFLNPSDLSQWIFFGDTLDNDIGGIKYEHATDSFRFRTNGVSDRMILDSAGNVGIGETSPSARLDIIGSGVGGVFALEVNNPVDGNGIEINTVDVTVNNALVWNQGADIMFDLFSDTGNDAKLRLLNSGVINIEFTTDGDSYFLGNLGIGIAIPTEELHVVGDILSTTGRFLRDTNDYIEINATTIDFRLDGTLDMRLENDGDLHVEGDVIAYSSTTSDPRFKINKQGFSQADIWPILNSLIGYQFQWKHNFEWDYGFMADEVKKVLPYAVEKKKDSLDHWKIGGGEFLILHKDKILPIVVEGVKDLNIRVTELESENEGLKKLINELR